jgi:hypothetical protein
MILIFQNPGPAAYQLPSTNVHKSRAPAFSMRTKETNPRYGDVNPGPASNYYHLVSEGVLLDSCTKMTRRSPNKTI